MKLVKNKNGRYSTNGSLKRYLVIFENLFCHHFSYFFLAPQQHPNSGFKKAGRQFETKSCVVIVCRCNTWRRMASNSLAREYASDWLGHVCFDTCSIISAWISTDLQEVVLLLARTSPIVICYLASTVGTAFNDWLILNECKAKNTINIFFQMVEHRAVVKLFRNDAQHREPRNPSGLGQDPNRLWEVLLWEAPGQVRAGLQQPRNFLLERPILIPPNTGFNFRARARFL